MDSHSKPARQLVGINGIVYDCLLWIFDIVLDLFFREIHPRSSWRVPREGPVLFVAAPHANQVWKYIISRTRIASLITIHS
jgi:glycerol-3-phosphate O-acyltransferase/dihydroxyacetone phosphate acyltransferase